MNEYYYEFARVNDYCYPDSFVLRNKLELRESEALERAERRLSSARIAEIMDFPIKGKFDLKHLCAIHRYIFQDIYSWAGELRTVNIAKGNQFCLCQHLEAKCHSGVRQTEIGEIFERHSAGTNPGALGVLSWRNQRAASIPRRQRQGAARVY